VTAETHEDRTPAAERGTLSATHSAKDTIVIFYVAGIVGLGVGLGLFFSNMPSTEYVAWSDSYSDSGSEGLTILGAVVAGISQIMLTIAVIASGVRLGMKQD
jgi:hypothetical protein